MSRSDMTLFGFWLLLIGSSFNIPSSIMLTFPTRPLFIKHSLTTTIPYILPSKPKIFELLSWEPFKPLVPAAAPTERFGIPKPRFLADFHLSCCKNIVALHSQSPLYLTDVLLAPTWMPFTVIWLHEHMLILLTTPPANLAFRTLLPPLRYVYTCSAMSSFNLFLSSFKMPPALFILHHSVTI